MHFMSMTTLLAGSLIRIVPRVNLTSLQDIHLIAYNTFLVLRFDNTMLILSIYLFANNIVICSISCFGHFLPISLIKRIWSGFVIASISLYSFHFLVFYAFRLYWMLAVGQVFFLFSVLKQVQKG